MYIRKTGLQKLLALREFGCVSSGNKAGFYMFHDHRLMTTLYKLSLDLLYHNVSLMNCH